MAKARIIRKHGAAVVVMAFDEEGQVQIELLVAYYGETVKVYGRDIDES